MEVFIGILAGLAGLGALFWGVFGIVVIAAILSVETENFKLTTPVVLLGLLALIWVTGIHPIEWLRGHVMTLVLYLIGYLVVGSFYGVARYMFYVHEINDKLHEWANLYRKNITALTPNDVQDFRCYARLQSFPPKVADSKKRIIFWCIYWPFSMPGTLINKPIKRFFTFVYNRVSTLLQRFTDRVFRNVVIISQEK